MSPRLIPVVPACPNKLFPIRIAQRDASQYAVSGRQGPLSNFEHVRSELTGSSHAHKLAGSVQGSIRRNTIKIYISPRRDWLA